MNATGKRRLLKLADFLEGLPKSKKFDMGFFAGDVAEGRPKCGTAACAAGYAACIPSFRRAGYRLTKEGSGVFETIGPAFEHETGDGALRAFFRIDQRGVVTLFGADNPNSAKAAAKRIRKLVASRAA